MRDDVETIGGLALLGGFCAVWAAYLAMVDITAPRPRRRRVSAPAPEPGLPDEDEPMDLGPSPNFRWHADDGDVTDEPPAPRPRELLQHEQNRHFLTFGRKVESGCPKCNTRNRIRKEQGLAPLPGYTYSKRTRDGSLWCAVHDEYFTPLSEDAVLQSPAEAA